MTIPAEEPSDALSNLRKQLILSQVQLLELEDTRDELAAALKERTETLAQLQQVTSQLLTETQHALQIAESKLAQAQKIASAAEATVAELKAQISTASQQLDVLKSSWSWRLTKPLRWIGSFFQ